MQKLSEDKAGAFGAGRLNSVYKLSGMYLTEDEYLFGHFKQLNVDLPKVRPIFEVFCLETGFVPATRISLGRYPRFRVDRTEPCGQIRLWFDFSMGLTSEGQRYEFYSPDLPYELGCGAVIDRLTEKRRYSKTILCFENRSMNFVLPGLAQELRSHLAIIQAWDLPTILASEPTELHV